MENRVEGLCAKTPLLERNHTLTNPQPRNTTQSSGSTHQDDERPTLAQRAEAAAKADEEDEGAGADEHPGGDVEVRVLRVPSYHFDVADHVLVHHQPDAQPQQGHSCQLKRKSASTAA